MTASTPAVRVLVVIGKFMGDWNYALVYDFGGSSDGFASTGSFGAAPPSGGTSIGFLPGGGLSGIEIASLGYSGFKPFGGNLVIEGGYMDTLFTMDEATSSNDILFMERASPGVIAANIAAGDFRSAVGARWYTDTFWAGAYATGPTSGAIHSAFDPERPPGTAHRSDHAHLDGRNCECIWCTGLQCRSGRDLRTPILSRRIFLV